MESNEKIIVVSGLPRSGTSLLMQILQAAGIPLLTDSHRAADEHNPKGYFEFEPVKSLPHDTSWLPAAKGKAVKIISHFLPHLPQSLDYTILFMNRDLEEIIQSQNKMLQTMNRPLGKLSIAKLKEKFASHLNDVHHWLAKQPNIVFTDIQFNALISSPDSELLKIWQFLKINAPMDDALSVIDKRLYRSRKTGRRP